MGGWAQALTQGAGRGGNELGQAKTGLRDERLQMLQLGLFFQQLKQQIEQQKQQMERANLPQFEGTVGTPGGGTGVLNRDPNTGKTSMDSLVPGMSKDTVSKQILDMAGKSSEKGYKQALTQLAQAVDQGLIDPMKAMERAIAMTGTEAGKEVTQKTSFKFEPSKGIISDKEGTEWSIYDPNLPPDLKTLVEAEGRRTQEKDKAKATDEQRRSEQTLERSMTMADRHDESMLKRDAVKTSDTARQSYVNYQASIKDMEAANPRSHLALIFHAVRAMVQGAGRMTQSEIMQEAKAGSFGDRMKRWATMASEGLLPDDQVQQIISVVKDDYESKRGAARMTWEYAYKDKTKNPLPPWLRTAAGEEENKGTTPTPPAGFVPDKP